MAHELSAPPVLSTPDSHILSEVEPVTAVEPSQRLSDEQIIFRYEIERTVDEIKQNRWRRIALQFPDHMLPDSARVYYLLARGLSGKLKSSGGEAPAVMTAAPVPDQRKDLSIADEKTLVKLTILGDTSYGSCCVDEIAAEHVAADAVVHYGRSCLSPTARLPVIHVFTQRELELDHVWASFKAAFPEKTSKVIVTADSPFAPHVKKVVAQLRTFGYTDVFAADLVHDPASLIPNRTVPDPVKQDPSRLGEWDLFHISDPPTSLLLTLSSRMKSVHIYPTVSDRSTAPPSTDANTPLVLRRRYALITSLGTVSTWGILINTLSVKNYLHVVDHVKKQISNAGKKSYLFVVGKLNAAKLANFAEIGGWVVIGCWESSLVDSRDFFKPVITPFELGLVLAGDENRLWTGEWRSDFQVVLDQAQEPESGDESRRDQSRMPGSFIDDDSQGEEPEEIHDYDSEEESVPPEFDLRTGRYVSHTRPLGSQEAVGNQTENSESNVMSTALTRRSKGEVLAVKGIASPAAQFLAEKRTWRGLGSDFEIKYEDEEEQGGLIEEGRTGVARGYTVGESTQS